MTKLEHGSGKHHYVPQFYLRNFTDSLGKLRVWEIHRQADGSNGQVVDLAKSKLTPPKSIGYEIGLHNLPDSGECQQIERLINTNLETPFAQGQAWGKVRDGRYDEIDETDTKDLYWFVRHMYARNPDKRKMFGHYGGEGIAKKDVQNPLFVIPTKSRNNSSTSMNAQLIFLTSIFVPPPDDLSGVSMFLCRSPLRLRTSTSPVVLLSDGLGNSILGSDAPKDRMWWLTLTKEFGLLVSEGGPGGFRIVDIESVVAMAINRFYMVQLGSGWARYLLAEDNFVDEDLVWAQFLRTETSPGNSAWIRRSNVL